MTTHLTIVESTIESLPEFIQLLDEVGQWLWDKGVKQWPPGSHHRDQEHLLHLVENGCLILAYQGERLAGGCILSEINADWPGPAKDAMYLSSLVVARFAAGTGLGTHIFAACAEAARQRGKSCLRLDCWDGNDFLKAYYQREGFRLLQAVQEHDYFVRLFEKDVGD